MELLLLGRGVKLDLGRTEFLLLPGDGELAEPGLVVHGLLDGGLPLGGSRGTEATEDNLSSDLGWSVVAAHKHKPQDREVVSSNPIGAGVFLSSISSGPSWRFNTIDFP